MKIEDVDFFYVSMPRIRDIGDGSQDALLVRVRAGEMVGWGECEASPLVSIASWICPMSHSACKPLAASVRGQRLDDVTDIERIHLLAREQSMDLLQADHTLSGIDVALWDLLGKRLGEPVYRLLGQKRAHAKIAYASQLFGDDPQSTLEAARQVRADGFRAAKFGWGPYGKGSAKQDGEQVRAAREGLGEDGILLVDAGTVWGEDVEAARERLGDLEASSVRWLEEPFESGALEAYRALAGTSSKVALAAGEGCNNFQQARNMIDHAGIGYVQIDAGRIGGITAARRVHVHARSRGVTFVNHTFTTDLALRASLHPYAGSRDEELCEFPVAPSELAHNLTRTRLEVDGDGRISLPEVPGIGVEPDPEVMKRHLVDVEITVAGEVLYRTPSV